MLEVLLQGKPARRNGLPPRIYVPLHVVNTIDMATFTFGRRLPDRNCPTIAGMNRLDPLLAYSLTPSELTRHLACELLLHTFAMLLGRGTMTLASEADGFTRALPH